MLRTIQAAPLLFVAKAVFYNLPSIVDNEGSPCFAWASLLVF